MTKKKNKKKSKKTKGRKKIAPALVSQVSETERHRLTTLEQLQALAESLGRDTNTESAPAIPESANYRIPIVCTDFDTSPYNSAITPPPLPEIYPEDLVYPEPTKSKPWWKFW